MDEYIERDSTIQKIVEIANQYNGSGQPDFGMLKAANIIRNERAADVAMVIHAEWIRYRESLFHYCSKCWEGAPINRSTKSEMLTAFCPHCGAKMDGGKNNEA